MTWPIIRFIENFKFKVASSALIFLYPLLCFCQEESASLVVTVEKGVRLALKYNRQFLLQSDDIEIAKYDVDLAESEFALNWIPTGQTAYGGSDRSHGRAIIGGGLELSKKCTLGTLVTVAPSLVKRGRHYHSDVEVEVVQPLLRGFGKENQLSHLRSAQFALRTASRDLIIAENQLVYRVIEALYGVRRQEIALQLNEKSLKRVERFYQAARLKEKIGMSSSLDLYRSEYEKRLAEESLAHSYELLEDAKDELRNLLALSFSTPIQVEVPMEYTSDEINVEKALEIAFQYRCEIAQAEDDRLEKKRLSLVAKNNLLPQIDLVMNYANLGRSRRFAKEWNKDRENVWSIGLSTASFSPGSQDVVEFQQSLLSLAANGREGDEIRFAIALEVKRAARSIERASHRINSEKEQMRTAEGELKLSKIRFDRGLGDNFNVIQAEKSLTASEKGYFDAIVDHILGEYQLVMAMGLLTDLGKGLK